jgi:hypothetical protein
MIALSTLDRQIGDDGHQEDDRREDRQRQVEPERRSAVENVVVADLLVEIEQKLPKGR